MLPVFSPASCLLSRVLELDCWPQPELSPGVCTCGLTENHDRKEKNESKLKYNVMTVKCAGISKLGHTKKKFKTSEEIVCFS